MSRVALISGAARGIGAATATLLASRGWYVVAVDIAADDPALPYRLGTKAELDAVAAAAPDRIHPVAADVRDLDALQLAVADAEHRWGGVDAVVAAAGVVAGGVAQQDVPLEQERAVLEVNLAGVLNLARAAIPALLRRPAPRAGRFVAVGSAAATRGLPNLAAYCASKAGVTGLVRALAVELAESGVTVNAVSPGSTDSPILAESARLYGLGDPAQFATHHPIGRLVEPAEVAAAIAFLLGPDTDAITGAVIPVDGGMTL
jgi:SDR family mycofactocin-dependent oxidoreductase